MLESNYNSLLFLLSFKCYFSLFLNYLSGDVLRSLDYKNVVVQYFFISFSALRNTLNLQLFQEGGHQEKKTFKHVKQELKQTR